MGAYKEYLAGIEELEAADADAAGVDESALPPFEGAIVVEDELPEMPAPVIGGILLETHKMLLTGPSKSHKTWGLINLAISVATGGYWLGFPCSKRRVLYVDFETDKRTLQKRIATVARAKGADVGETRANLAVWPLRGTPCGLEEIVSELFRRCGRGEYGLVVIDPAYMVQDGDENNARDIREFFARLDRLCVGLECAVVISHHHSKGAQGLKSAIDRGSGSGVFGRAPDAVLDMTELVLEAGTMELARKVNSIAECRHPSAWRMSFTLREFEPRDALDLWFCFPLHQIDDTGLLADCKPNYGGQSEARKKQLEAENQGKVSQLDSACERLIGAGGFVYRDAVERELEWSITTVNRWLDRSKRFMRQPTSGGGKTKIVRRPPDGGAQAKGACQDALPLNP